MRGRSPTPLLPPTCVIGGINASTLGSPVARCIFATTSFNSSAPMSPSSTNPEPASATDSSRRDFPSPVAMAG